MDFLDDGETLWTLDPCTKDHESAGDKDQHWPTPCPDCGRPMTWDEYPWYRECCSCEWREEYPEDVYD